MQHDNDFAAAQFCLSVSDQPVERLVAVRPIAGGVTYVFGIKQTIMFRFGIPLYSPTTGVTKVRPKLLAAQRPGFPIQEPDGFGIGLRLRFWLKLKRRWRLG